MATDMSSEQKRILTKHKMHIEDKTRIQGESIAYDNRSQLFMWLLFQLSGHRECAKLIYYAKKWNPVCKLQ